nr:hypothetical protein [Sphingobium sp. AEW4]
MHRSKHRQFFEERADYKRSNRADGQHLLRVPALEPLEQTINSAEGFEQRRRQRETLVSQFQAAIGAAKERDTQAKLQGLDLVADRRLRDAQVVRRPGK